MRPVDEATFARAGVAEDAHVVAADVAVHQVCAELRPDPWCNDPTTPDLSPMLKGLPFTNRCGSLDFVPFVLTELTKTQLWFRVSGHYPLWVEFIV